MQNNNQNSSNQILSSLTSNLILVSHIEESSKKLKAKLHQQGYLYFKGIISKVKLEEVYIDAVSVLRQYNWIQNELSVDRLKLNRNVASKEAQKNLFSVLLHWSSSKSFDYIVNDPELSKILTKILGTTYILHPLRLARWCRVGFPSDYIPEILPHQDIEYVGLPEDTYTVWIPIHDCPIELGGLAIYPGSNLQGQIKSKDRKNAPYDTSYWVNTNYECGDILIFHSLTIHKASRNITYDTLRLSMDLRFCTKKRIISAMKKDPNYRLLLREQNQKIEHKLRNGVSFQ
jgi:ectoine hydroxylase-related dioxygenase (phytanoyl-CoA dioxygenase family)